MPVYQCTCMQSKVLRILEAVEIYVHMTISKVLFALFIHTKSGQFEMAIPEHVRARFQAYCGVQGLS